MPRYRILKPIHIYIHIYVYTHVHIHIPRRIYIHMYIWHFKDEVHHMAVHHPFGMPGHLLSRRHRSRAPGRALRPLRPPQAPPSPARPWNRMKDVRYADIWVVVKIMVSFWVLDILRHLLFSVPNREPSF